MQARSAMLRRAGRIALVLAVLLLVLLVVAQLVLPGVAADRIRSRVGRYGQVLSVSVSAWPAVELLWGHADEVKVRAGELSLSPSEAASRVWEGRGADRISFSARTVHVGPLLLSDATLTKRGRSLVAQASASSQAVAAALPPGFGVKLLRSGGGEVEVLASGALFGVGASVHALALAQNGVLVAHPLGFLLEGLTLTLFADPHVAISGVAASEQAGGYRLRLAGALR